LEIGKRHRMPNQGSKLGGGWQPFVFRLKLLGEDGSVRRGVVKVKQPGLFSPKFRTMSSHVSTQSPQNLAAETGIHSLASWDRCFALSHLPYRWRYQSGIFFNSTSYTGICGRIMVITNVTNKHPVSRSGFGNLRHACQAWHADWHAERFSMARWMNWNTVIMIS
jgi:hypothetical protein